VQNLFQRISSVVIEPLDDLISFVVRIFKLPEPTALTRKHIRARLAGAYLGAIIPCASLLYEVYESGELQRMFLFLREHHPLVVALPMVIAFFVLTEFMVGTISGLGLFLIVIRSEKPMSDTEWIVEASTWHLRA
jgi:hypothetical protein